MNYVLSSESEYFIDKEINKISNEIISDEFNLVKLNYYDTNIEEIVNECNTPTFFGDNKVVCVENCVFLSTNSKGKLSSNDEKRIIEYLKLPNLSTTLIMTINEKLDSRKKVVKEITKLCRIKKFDNSKEFNKKNFIFDFLNKKNIILKQNELDYLISRISDNPKIIECELEKLALYNDEIDINVISSLINKPILDSDQRKFDFISALYQKDRKKILSDYSDFKKLGIEPLALIGLIESQFRFLLQVKILKEQYCSEKEIADILNANPYRVKIVLKNANLFNSKKIELILNELARLDQNFKMGKVDINIGFDKFILDCCK